MSIKIAFILFTSLIITNCGSSKKGSENDQKKLDPVVDTMSPGTALVEFEVIEVTPAEDKNTSIYKIKFINVIKVGSSTPSIQKESIHLMRLNNEKFENDLLVGNKKTGLFNYEEQIQQFADQSNWKLIHITKA